MVGYTKCSCLLACLAIALCGCADHELEPSGKVVRVGVIGPLSGPDETVGLSGLQGVELALGLQTHLDNGDRIELVKRDDRGAPWPQYFPLSARKSPEIRDCCQFLRLRNTSWIFLVTSRPIL